MDVIDLIPSENILPASVRKLLADEKLTKYCEGYPGKRYYPGCADYDAMELSVQHRALELFGLDKNTWRVNVQAYSGAIANLALLLGLLNPKDTILSLGLYSGGHLSHGSSASFTGKLFSAINYSLIEKKGELQIDYAQLESLARTHAPKAIISGASAYPYPIDFKRIGTIARKLGAYHIADISHFAGLVSAGEYSSPFAHADAVMTTTHKSLFGPRGALIFSRTDSRITKKNKIDLPTAIDKAVFPGLQGGPHMNVIAGIGEGLHIAARSKKYYRQVVANARALKDALKERGYRVAGAECHMILVHNIDGAEVERDLEKIGILANRNGVQNDRSFSHPSAVRMGTYSVTARGMRESQMLLIADAIDGVIKKSNLPVIKKTVAALAKKFPIT